jgi:predicted GNAT superfamily acetyltransferase
VSSSSVIIRKCESLDDMRACVALQQEVWNFTDIELVPLRMFVVAQKIGGQVIGALQRGFELIEWTFDPLEIKNAYLNIEKLGAIARRYNVNQYGITSSPLQGGLPTDRLIAEWWLKSERVESLLRNGNHAPIAPVMTISVPSQVYQWKASTNSRGLAKEVQDRNREQFLKAFSEGLVVLGYERDREGNGRFLLGSWPEKWSYGPPDRSST